MAQPPDKHTRSRSGVREIRTFFQHKAAKGDKGKETTVRETRASKSTPSVGYNPVYLARKYRISKAQAEQLIERYPGDRAKINEAARALKSKE